MYIACICASVVVALYGYGTLPVSYTHLETDNRLNFLDLTVIRHIDNLKFKIYRKPTTTDVTIHADSHHPFSQKIAAYNSFIHRLLTIPHDIEDFNDELNTIKHIAAVSYTHLDVYKRQV